MLVVAVGGVVVNLVAAALLARADRENLNVRLPSAMTSPTCSARSASFSERS